MKDLSFIFLPNIMFVLVVALPKHNELHHRAKCIPTNPCQNVLLRMVCGFDSLEKRYRMFKSRCHLTNYAACNNIEMSDSPVLYCMRNDGRRSSDDSCPVFCPEHYRPVCGASKLRDYQYRSFKNGCYLDMLNCRAQDEYSGYVEVPLSFCQRHGMRNIWKEQVIVYNSPFLNS